MVWVVVELHRLVCIAFLEVVLRCSCHSTCLGSLQAAVIAPNIDYDRYPRSRTYTFGAQLTF